MLICGGKRRRCLSFESTDDEVVQNQGKSRSSQRCTCAGGKSTMLSGYMEADRERELLSTKKKTFESFFFPFMHDKVE